MENKLLDAALAYAKRGWRVLPIKMQAKTPLLADWPHRASVDEKIITGWWAKWPQANVGIATGKESGLVVLDLDVKGEVNGLAAAEAKWNFERPEVAQQTGSGGIQAFYAWPQEVEIRNKAELDGTKGVDIRAEGGYVVVPPSLHPCGKNYEWLGNPNDALEPPPAWMIDLCRATPPVAIQRELGQVVSEGNRNAALASIAGTMRRRGLAEASIYAALAAENAERCHPPLEDAEVRKIATSVARYTPAATQPEAEPADVEANTNANPPVEALEALMANNRKFAATWNRKRDDFCKPEQYDYALAAFAATVGWSPQQIADLIMACRRKYSQPPLDKERLGRIVGQALHLTRQTRAILAINSAPTGASAADEPQVMEKLSDVLGIKVRRFIQHGRENSRYILELANGQQVILGNADAILSVGKFRARMLDAASIVFPTIKQQAWDEVCRALIGAAEFIDNEETTTAWLGRDMVESYMESESSVLETPESQWKQSFIAGTPFIHDGMLYISAMAVATHARIQRAMKLPHADLCEALRQAGFTRKKITARAGKVHCKSLWAKPYQAERNSSNVESNTHEDECNNSDFDEKS